MSERFLRFRRRRLSQHDYPKVTVPLDDKSLIGRSNLQSWDAQARGNPDVWSRIYWITTKSRVFQITFGESIDVT